MTIITFLQMEQLQDSDLLVIPVCMDEPLSMHTMDLDTALKGGLKYNVDREAFIGKCGSILQMTTNGLYRVPKVILMGIGRRSELTSQILQEIGGQIATFIAAEGLQNVTIDTSDLEKEHAAAHIAFGIRMRSWTFDKYKSAKVPKIEEVQFICTSPLTQHADHCYYDCLYQGIELAREAISEPANVLYPESFAALCQTLSKEGLVVEVLDEFQLESISAGGILAVGKGSVNPPRLVSLQWKGAKEDCAPIALVGKGVCYDSGGINIKNTHLVEMKWDKAGAGAVLGTLYALAKMKAPVNVVGVIGLVENMPDGGSMKPGDIIKMMNGKTVEIIDTDNEGRLVLADCITYAQKRYHPKVIIDLGTLTLETFGALAGEYAGLFCEDEVLSKRLIKSGNVVQECLWGLPMGSAFAKQIESSVADLKNAGIFGFGESSAAAEFLKCFVDPKVTWAHIDIAGVAWVQEEKSIFGVGVTGFGVRLLTEFLLNP